MMQYYIAVIKYANKPELGEVVKIIEAETYREAEKKLQRHIQNHYEGQRCYRLYKADRVEII